MGSVNQNRIVKAEANGTITNLIDSNIIDDGTNVGISTPTPEARLDVSKSTRDATFGLQIGGNGYLSVNPNPAAGDYNSLVQAGDKTIIFSNGPVDTGALVIGPWSNSAKGIRMDSSGNIGVGKSPSSSYKLDVQGEIFSNGNTISVRDLEAEGDDYNDAVNEKFRRAGMINGDATIGWGLHLNSPEWTWGGDPMYFTGGDFRFRTVQDNDNLEEKVRITPGGYVGIGNTSPGSKLVVKGSGNSSGSSSLNVTDSSDNSILFVRDDGRVGLDSTSPGAALDIQKSINAASGAARGVNIEQTLMCTADFDKLTALRIKPTFNNGGVASCMSINGLIIEKGNVGIGVTDAPDYQLKVVAQDYSAITGAVNPIGAIYGETTIDNTKAIYGHAYGASTGNGISVAVYGYADNASAWAGCFSGGKGVEVNGNIKVSGSNNSLIIDSPYVPTVYNESTGVKGQIAWDANYLYVKVQTSPSHIWKRVALATW